MTIIVFLIFGQIALNLASEPTTVLESPANCTRIDKATLQKKVTVTMNKVIEQLFQDASFFRKKRFATGENLPKSSTVYLDTVVPQEFEREHQRVEEVMPKSKREIHYHYLNSWEYNAFVDYKKKPKNHYEDAGDTTLWRSKRFCIPLSYDDGVKNMVKKVVDETFKKIELYS